MNKNEKHEELKVLSGYVYHNDKFNKPEGWKNVSIESKKDGFYAEVFSKDKDVAIVIRGSEDIGDLASDSALKEGRVPLQANDGKELYEQIKKEYCQAPNLWSKVKVSF